MDHASDGIEGPFIVMADSDQKLFDLSSVSLSDVSKYAARVLKEAGFSNPGRVNSIHIEQNTRYEVPEGQIEWKVKAESLRLRTFYKEAEINFELCIIRRFHDRKKKPLNLRLETTDISSIVTLRLCDWRTST